ncbi:MAG: aminopeptidase [Betaproteobacteria bacterium]|nr:MAG: aminopeptidase [Betaproteobacteria bacterium]
MRVRCLLLLAALAPLFCGCGTLRYYSQAVSGHLDLMRRASPIEAQLGSDAVAAALKAKLRAALRIRQFASRALGLPDNGSYKSYADLGRQYVAWNVFAAPEFSIEPIRSCYPFAGCVGYRAYFAEADARAESAALRARGYDAYVGGVPAYSTLGWFDDPLLNTFIHYPEAELARLIFHELAHQLLYVKNDTRFNESFATTVEQAGVERWLAENGNERERAAFDRSQRRKREFVALVLKYRTILEQYYRQDLPAQEMRLGKARRFAEMEQEYRRLKASWGGFAGYERWFAGNPNNATLASVALYTELAPAFRALLEREGGDLQRFYATAKDLAKLPKEEREARMRSVLEN